MHVQGKNIGVGIIGTGFGAAVQLPGFLGVSDARVVGVAARNTKRAEELAKMHRLPQVFASPEELIASPEIDLVSIATPPIAHAELVRAALEQRKAILCEKPFTLSTNEARTLLREANARSIVHAIDFEFRELPAWQLLKAHLQSGSLGEIRSADFRWIVGTWADPQRAWSWQCDRSHGGGIVSALGVHLFDAAEWLLGPVQMLHATTAIAIQERPSADSGQSRRVTAEDHAQIEMRNTQGIPTMITLSNVEKEGSGLTMEIVCEHGTLHLESTSREYGHGLCVREERMNEEPRVLLAPENASGNSDSRIPIFRRFASRLVRAVQERDTTFRPSFIEGLRTQMIRETVRESAAARRWIDIPPLET